MCRHDGASWSTDFIFQTHLMKAFTDSPLAWPKIPRKDESSPAAEMVRKVITGYWAGFETRWKEAKERKRMILAEAKKDKGSSKIVFLKMVLGPLGVGSENLLGEWYVFSAYNCEMIQCKSFQVVDHRSFWGAYCSKHLITLSGSLNLFSLWKFKD